MPLYEYECQQCKRHTEKIQKFSDPEITVCPHCGGLLQRVISAPAIAFKGGGWYADGYGSSAPKKSKSDTGSDSGAAASSNTAAPSAGESSASAAPSTPAPAPAPVPKYTPASEKS
jgi:putative FmdB family regulatory protein